MATELAKWTVGSMRIEGEIIWTVHNFCIFKCLYVKIKIAQVNLKLTEIRLKHLDFV